MQAVSLGSRSEWGGESWRQGKPHKAHVEVAAMANRCLFHRTSEEGRVPRQIEPKPLHDSLEESCLANLNSHKDMLDE